MSRATSAGARSLALVIATRDRPALLNQCLEAVAAQTAPPLEVVVVNDGGEAVDGALAGLHPPPRLIRNEISRGVPAALNQGVRATTASHVALCDDDDLFAPDHLETLALALSSGAGLAYTDARAFASHPSDALGVLDRDFDPALLRETNYIAPSSIAFRRELYDRIEGLDESLSIYWDWDFFLRLSQIAPVIHAAGGLTHYRVHPGSIQTTTPGEVRAAQLQRLCDKHGLGTLPVKHLFDNFRRSEV